jgi:nucleotide-binding universal stress UspA family protein
MFNKILVAIDTSDIADRVFERALTLAQIDRDRSHLLLVNVMSPHDAGYPDLPVLPALDPHYPANLPPEVVATYVQKWEDYRHPALAQLAKFKQTATAAGIKVESLQVFGEPGATICNLAQDKAVDLIAISRHGKKGWSELWLGSVSNYVLHHAPCSVLTVQHHSPQ